MHLTFLREWFVCYRKHNNYLNEALCSGVQALTAFASEHESEFSFARVDFEIYGSWLKRIGITSEHGPVLFVFDIVAEQYYVSPFENPVANKTIIDQFYTMKNNGDIEVRVS